MLDPRAVANFILDVGKENNIPISNLALNKIAYFLHGTHLALYNQPLIDAKIEAWEYGPVIREIYHEFKKYEKNPIEERATSINLATGEREVCEYSFGDADRERKLKTIVESYLQMKPFYLVKLSHVDDGPWHNAWFHEERVNPGMEITNDSIKSYFQKQVRH